MIYEIENDDERIEIDEFDEKMNCFVKKINLLESLHTDLVERRNNLISTLDQFQININFENLMVRNDDDQNLIQEQENTEISNIEDIIENENESINNNPVEEVSSILNIGQLDHLEGENKIKIYYQNIDKLTKVKAKLINKLIKENNYDMACIVETNKPKRSSVNVFREYNTIEAANILPDRKGGILVVFNNEKIQLGEFKSHSRYLVLKSNRSMNGKKIRFIIVYFPLESHRHYEPGTEASYEWEWFYPEIEQIIEETIEEDEVPVIIGDCNDKINEILNGQVGGARQQYVKSMIEENELTAYNPDIHRENWASLTDQIENQRNPITYEDDRSGTRIDHIILPNHLVHSLTVFYHQRYAFNIIATHLPMSIFIETNQFNLNQDELDNEFPKIKRKWDTNKLLKNEHRGQFLNTLIELDPRGLSYQELINNISETADAIIPLDQKFKVESYEIRSLKRLKNYYGRHNMTRERSRTARAIKRRMDLEENEQFRERMIQISQKGNLYGKDFFKMIRGVLKPQDPHYGLMKNNEGCYDIKFTIESLEEYWKDLQNRNLYEDETAKYEGRLYSCILKRFGKEALKNFFKLCKEKLGSYDVISDVEIGYKISDYIYQYNYNGTVEEFEAEVFANDHEMEQYGYGEKFNKEEIIKQIESINKNKAIGFDQIDKNILENLPNSYYERITELFNSYMANGFFPSYAKLNTMVNIPKKAILTADSARPIVLTPLLQRVFQALIYPMIAHELDKHIPKVQFGFTTQRSTICAVFLFLLRWRKAQTEKYNVAYLLLDITKAFNSMEYVELCDKVIDTNLDEDYTRALFNLTCNNMYIIRVGNNKWIGKAFQLTKGVNQGTKVSPKCFVFYTKEYKEWLQEFNEVLRVEARDERREGHMYFTYADDTAIEVNFKNMNYDRVKRNIRRLIEFISMKLASKYMKLNKDKTEIITNQKNFGGVFIDDDVEIIPKKEFRLYGIFMQINKSGNINFNPTYLKYHEYAAKIVNSAFKLSMYNKRITCNVMSNIIKSFLNGKIDYGAEIVKFTDIQYKRIDIITRQFIKNKYFMKKSSLNEAIYVISKSSDMKLRHELRRIMYYIKLKYLRSEQSPNMLTEMIEDEESARYIRECSLANKLDISGEDFGLNIEQFHINFVNLHFYDQIEAIMIQLEISKKHHFFNAIKNHIKNTIRMKYVLDIAGTYEDKLNLNDMKDKLVTIRRDAFTYNYRIKEIPAYESFKITGLNFIKYFSLSDDKPRFNMGEESVYYKSYIKFYSNTYRFGRWVHSNSEYKDADGIIQRAHNGRCNFCDVYEQDNNELETDIHMFKCMYYTDIVIKFIDKVKIILTEQRVFIEDIVRSNRIQDLLYVSAGRMHHLGFRIEKEKWEEFHRECMKFTFDLRMRRGSMLKEMTNLESIDWSTTRYDVTNVREYKIIMNKLKVTY